MPPAQLSRPRTGRRLERLEAAQSYLSGSGHPAGGCCCVLQSRPMLRLTEPGNPDGGRWCSSQMVCVSTSTVSSRPCRPLSRAPHPLFFFPFRPLFPLHSLSGNDHDTGPLFKFFFLFGKKINHVRRLRTQKCTESSISAQMFQFGVKQLDTTEPGALTQFKIHNSRK